MELRVDLIYRQLFLSATWNVDGFLLFGLISACIGHNIQHQIVYNIYFGCLIR